MPHTVRMNDTDYILCDNGSVIDMNNMPLYTVPDLEVRDYIPSETTYGEFTLETSSPKVKRKYCKKIDLENIIEEFDKFSNDQTYTTKHFRKYLLSLSRKLK